MSPQHFFDRAWEVNAHDVALRFLGFDDLAWDDFVLNPRRLRGSDFLMRWSQGVWSEKRLIEAVKGAGNFFALPYGPSGTAPENDPRAHELYFERLEKAGIVLYDKPGRVKRPDLLVFRNREASLVERAVKGLGGVSELPFHREDESGMEDLLRHSILAVECENSLWKAKQMPGYGAPLTPQRRLGGRVGLKKTAVVPTVILKEVDRRPLMEWQKARGVPIHIWHVFYDTAFGLSMDKAEELIREGAIESTVQTFQAPGGATTKKTIYKIYYHHAYLLGESVEEPHLEAAHIVDKNGHILPYVRFEGGRLALSEAAVAVLNDAQCDRGGR